MLIRRETDSDVAAVRRVTAAAFGSPVNHQPGEATLLDELRTDRAWIPAYSLVALDADGVVVGHVVCTRAHVDTAPVLGLGPISVRPDRQRQGVGSALVHTVLGSADARDEPLVALLGDPTYYRRFGFRLAAEFAIEPPVAAWRPHFQVRPLSKYYPAIQGAFAYAEPFDRI